MSTISASTTSTTAYKVTADTTGTLVLQTGSSPTTAMTISSSQIVTFANPPTATGAGGVSTNTAYGSGAMASTTGSSSGNTGVGTTVLAALTSGTNNTAMGWNAMALGTTAASNTAIGENTLFYNNGSANTAVGFQALQGTAGNTFTNNTAVGYQAAYSTTSGGPVTAIGYKAGYSMTSGFNNVFVGDNAGYSGTSGVYYNTFVGHNAGYSATGYGNTFIGSNSSTGDGAGGLVTSGLNNTILGGYNGNQGGLDIRTSSNNIVLSDGSGTPRLQVESTGNIQSMGACYRSQTLYTGSGVTGTSSTLDLPDRAMGYIQVFGIGAATERMTMYAFTNCGPSSIPVAITQVQTSGFNLTFTITTVNNYGGFTVSWSGSNSANITVTATYIGLSF